MEESSFVFPAIFCYSIFSNVSSASEWSWRSVQCPTPPPPTSFSVDNPRRIWFPLLLHLMLNKTDTVRLMACSFSCIWCLLTDRDFFRCSGTSGPWIRTCMIGYTFELLLFLFLIFLIPFQCLQVSGLLVLHCLSQKKETQSFQRERCLLVSPASVLPFFCQWEVFCKWHSSLTKLNELGTITLGSS